MRNYSIDKVELTWAGLDFKEGLAQGTSIQEARTAPSWSTKPTGTGKIVRVYNPDRSGTVTIQVDQESKLHQQLLAIAAADQVSRNQVFPMFMNDTSAATLTAYQNAFIVSEPDESRATEAGVVPWVFAFESLQRTPNPTDANLVGN